MLKCLTKCLTQENDEQKTKGVNINFVMKERTGSSRRWVDFLKSPSSCLFSTRRTKDFSYLIAANFSDLKTGRCASTNQRSPGYPLGTELSNHGQRNMTCG